LKIAVYTKDPYLYKKIALSLPECEVLAPSDTEEASGCELIFVDTDTTDISIDAAVTMSRHKSAKLKIPFSLSCPAELLRKCGGSPRCALIPERRAVLIMGEEIKLTELEYELFSLIVLSEGCISREDILSKIWRDGADSGVLNVYIHYLREKLERQGEKIIVSERGRGYTLSKKYAKLFKNGGESDAENR